MEVQEAKNYTVITLRIEEDLALLQKLLYAAHSGKSPDISYNDRLVADSLYHAILNCNKRKDIELRFT